MKTMLLTLLIAFSGSQIARAQFHLNGSATQDNDSCWTLTTATNFVVGSIWNEDKINLNESFQVLMELNFGSKDGNGADGIMFGFQPVSTSIGQAGEGIGFQGVAPSIGIEFDTWQNGNLNDPAFDHIAIVKNGNLNHNSGNTIAGPVPATNTSANIENGQWFPLRVNWDAVTHTLEVWFDCELRLTYTGDIVNEVFNGDPWVFWGFTSATGGSNNHHRVCYGYTTFLDGFEDVVICPGGQFQLGVGGGQSYHWTPETGLSDPGIPNPIASPQETTTYVVEVRDQCNNPFFDSLTVFIDGDTVFFDLGPDTVICEMEGLLLDATSFGTTSVEYQWTTGSSSPSVQPAYTGQYAVTVTIDDYCVADDRVFVTILPSPGQVSLGPDRVLCLGQELLLDATTSGTPTYFWPHNGATTPEVTITESGHYEVEIINECGTGSSAVHIDYEDCRQVFFPNAFTPNGDGLNDSFYPLDDGDVERVRQFRIFDRWGGQVFEATAFRPNDLTAAWDGYVRGRPANPGTYTWFAEVEFRDGVVVLLEGGVILIR